MFQSNNTSPNSKSLFAVEAERMNKLNTGKFAEESFGFKVMSTILAAVFVFAIFIPLFCYSFATFAFVTMKLWGWFVAPTFNLPPIHFLQAAGLALLFLLFFNEHGDKNSNGKTKKEIIYQSIGLLIRPWFLLLVGYIVHRFI